MKNILLFLISVFIFVSCASKEKSPRDLSFSELEEQYRSHQQQAFYTLNYILEKEPACEIAEKYAKAYLKAAEDFKKDWNYGNAIYQSNMALGYCAFQRKDLATAKKLMNAAIQTPGSPQLNSFGLHRFDMRLPTELLKIGEKQAVLDFLRESKRFWASDFSDKAIAEWEAQIEKGEIPKFTKYPVRK